MSVNYRYETMLFNNETTSREDYRDGAIRDVVRTVYKEKPHRLRVQPPPLKHTLTLTDWKTSHVPIDLLVKPKDIVRTDPKNTQQPYTPLEDSEILRVRAARPRLVMTPAVSMDDITNENVREILVKECYKSSTQSALEMAIALGKERPGVKAPLLGKLSPANPITLKRPQFPYVAPQWRMAAVAWDARQTRAYCDPSKEFYLSRPLRCKFCQETAAREMNRKMKCFKRSTM